MKLLQKIEELTLYTIEQNKKIEQQNQEIIDLKKQSKAIDELKQIVKRQSKKIKKQMQPHEMEVEQETAQLDVGQLVHVLGMTLLSILKIPKKHNQFVPFYFTKRILFANNMES